MKKTFKPENMIWALLGAIWAFISLFPIWVLFSATFSHDTQNITQVFFPSSFSNGISKIVEAIQTIEIGAAIVDTLAYTILTVFGIILVCSLVAYEFTFFNFPLKKVIFGLIMVSMMLPQVLYVIPLYRLVFNMGLADTFLGVSLPLMVSALAVFMLMQFLEDLPISFIESAKIDGAGHFMIYFRIVLPLLRNGIITTAILMVMRIWGQFLWPSLVTAEKIKPISVAIASILSPHYWVDSRVKIAAMLLAMLTPLIIYVFFQRKLIDGVTMSGIKG